MSSPILKSPEQTFNKMCTASCLKTTGLYDDLLLLSSLFHFFYFIFSAPISLSLFSNFPISYFFFFFMFFLKPLPSAVEKLLYTHIYNMHNIYPTELNGFLPN